MINDLSKILVAGVQELDLLKEPVPPASEDEVLLLENKIGHKLPADYREFLLTINGGRLNRDFGKKLKFSMTPLIEGTAAYTGSLSLHYIYCLFQGFTDYEKGMETLTLAWNFEGYSEMAESGYEFAPPDSIPIATVGGQDHILLVLDGEHKNKVLYHDYMVYPSELYENVSFVANSFTEFIGSLQIS